MLDHLKSKLKASVNFPSPPAIAQQIIALARDSDVDISQVAAVISRDPGLAAKLSKAANSPLYSRHRKSTNLRQAIVALGLQGATTMALGFCLIGTYRSLRSNGVDYERYWRRAILSSSAAKRFGAFQTLSAADDIFLAALLQDIAILGVDRAAPTFYRELPKKAAHQDFTVYETQRLGVDHAELGAWLLEYWKLPAPLCRAVAWSHAPPSEERSTAAGMAACCVALGSECAEILLASAAAPDFDSFAEHAREWLGIDAMAVAEVMGALVAELPEIERLFATKLLAPAAANLIVAQARELLVLREDQARPARDAPRAAEATTDPPLAVSEPPAAESEAHRRDGLTGLYNRGYVDLALRREFQAALKARWPLSVVYVDLDRFKEINELHGREAGDAVLVTVGRTIASVARDTDCVARYGGEEFVVVLPGLMAPGVNIFRERLIARLANILHPIRGSMVAVSASVGLATHTPTKPFQRAADMIEVARRCVYVSKAAGRDQPAGRQDVRDRQIPAKII